MAESTPCVTSSRDGTPAAFGGSSAPVTSDGRNVQLPSRPTATDEDSLVDAAMRTSAGEFSEFITLPSWRIQNLACDVVMVCREASFAAEAAVRSILDQRGIQFRLHLVDDGGEATSFVDSFRNHSDVIRHYNRFELGPWQTLHSLIPELKSQYVAIQDADSESRPGRLRTAVEALEAYGGEIFASSVSTGFGVIEPKRPQSGYDRYLPSETLVFRKATLIDLGGFSDRGNDADVELVFRAFLTNRRMIARSEPFVVCHSPFRYEIVGPPPVYSRQSQTLEQWGSVSRNRQPRAMSFCRFAVSYHSSLRRSRVS